MRRYVPIVIVVGAALGLGLAGATRTTLLAQETTAVPGADAYLGDGACAGCHRAQHDAWSKTKHANALSKLGRADRASGQCIRCHVTGSPAMIAAEGADPSRPNVQCEACHGPGRAHAEAARADRAATVKTTPVVEDTCTRCHNESSPHYKPFYFTALKGLVHRVQ